MNPDTGTFLRLIGRHLERGVEKPVPEYTTLVINEGNYAYFSHHGKVDAMNYSTAIFLINDEVRALYVVMQPDPEGQGAQKERRYLVKTLDQDIDEGDYVVVPSTVGHRLAVAKVVDVEAEVDFDSTTVVPWIVQRLNMSEFNQIIAQEDVAISKIKEAHFLEKKRNLVSSLMSASDLRSLPLATRKRDEDR